MSLANLITLARLPLLLLVVGLLFYSQFRSPAYWPGAG